MAGSTKADVAKTKDFISRVDDGSVRLAYRRDPEDTPRRCVLVGTVDRAQFLPRDPNPRRFVPITLLGGKATGVYRYMRKNRDRLFAEAVDLYMHDIPARLPEDLKEPALQAALEAQVP